MVPSPIVILFIYDLQSRHHDHQHLAFAYSFTLHNVQTLHEGPFLLQRYNNRDFQPSVPGVISGKEIITPQNC